MIEFRDVYKTYVSKRDTDVDALRGVSFKIEDGEFVFIIGRSGSGKSTLMKCITREEVPQQGEVLIDDFDISSMPRPLIPVLRRHIGMIYQDFRLIESKTVSENIAFAGEIVGIPRANLNRTVQLVLNVVGLKDKADSYPQELSGGEQQRVAIARAMVNNPKIIVADEPTGDLDPETSENIMALLLDINQSGSTVIVCTHDSNLVDRMKKRVIELRDGKVIRDQKSSGYEYIPEEEPVASLETLNVAFGDAPSFADDKDYSDSFDDEGYEAPPSPLLMFGDDKDSEAILAQQNAAKMAERLAFESAEEAVEEAAAEAAEETAAEVTAEAAVAETAVAAAEEIIEEPVEEAAEAPLETAEVAEEEPVEELIEEEALPVEELIEDTPAEERVQEAPSQEPSGEPAEEKAEDSFVFGDEVKEEKAEDDDTFGKLSSGDEEEDNDDWMAEAASGDEFIDLDIQEDDN